MPRHIHGSAHDWGQVLMFEGKSRSHGRAITTTYKVVKGYTPADLQALLGHEMQETSFI